MNKKKEENWGRFIMYSMFFGTYAGLYYVLLGI